jgi:hypothetical protein
MRAQANISGHSSVPRKVSQYIKNAVIALPVAHSRHGLQPPTNFEVDCSLPVDLKPQVWTKPKFLIVRKVPRIERQ